MSRLVLHPINLRDARVSHNAGPKGWKFGTSILLNGDLAGVGVAGRPVARALATEVSIEITGVCTLGVPNACSRLYAALCRAAAALGYTDCYTYTLQSECAACVKAAGFTIDAVCDDQSEWDRPRRHRDPEVTARANGPKYRWHRKLGPK